MYYSRGGLQIATSFADQNNPSGFYSIGAQNGAGLQQPVVEIATILLIGIGFLLIMGAFSVAYMKRRSKEVCMLNAT